MVKAEGGNNQFYIAGEVQSLRINNVGVTKEQSNIIDLTNWAALENLEVFSTRDGRGLRIRDKNNSQRFIRIEDRSSMQLLVQGSEGTAIKLDQSKLLQIGKRAVSLNQLLTDNVHYINGGNKQLTLTNEDDQISLKGKGNFHIRTGDGTNHVFDIDEGVGIALDTIHNDTQFRFKGLTYADVQLANNNTLWVKNNNYALLNAGQLTGNLSFVAQFEDGIANFKTGQQGHLSVVFTPRVSPGLSKPAGVVDVNKQSLGLAHVDGPLWRFASGIVASPLTGEVYDLQGQRYNNASYDSNENQVLFNTYSNHQLSLNPNKASSRIAPMSANVLEDGRWQFGDQNRANDRDFVVDPATWRVFKEASDQQPLKNMWFRYDGARGKHMVIDSGSGPGNRLNYGQTVGLPIEHFQQVLDESQQLQLERGSTNNGHWETRTVRGSFGGYSGAGFSRPSTKRVWVRDPDSKPDKYLTENYYPNDYRKAQILKQFHQELEHLRRTDQLISAVDYVKEGTPNDEQGELLAMLQKVENLELS